MNGGLLSRLSDVDWFTFIANNGFFLVIALIAVGWLFTYPMRKETAAKQRLARQQLARRCGWRHDDATDAMVQYRFSGTTAGGLGWELAHVFDSTGTGAEPIFRWRCWPETGASWPCIVLAPAGRFQVGTARTEAPVRRMVTKTLWGRDFHSGAAAGPAAFDAFLTSAVEWRSGNAEFSSAFQVILLDPGTVRGTFTPTVMRDLLEWPLPKKKFDPKRCVSLNGYDDEIVFEVRYGEFAPAVCEHIVRLGSAIAESLSKQATRSSF